jgi:hypothetical protein
MIEINNYKVDIETLKLTKPNGQTIHVDDLPYKEHNLAEILYTTQYIYEDYTEDYDLTEEQCLEVAMTAREYMDDYNVSEDDAIIEALNAHGIKEREEEDD